MLSCDPYYHIDFTDRFEWRYDALNPALNPANRSLDPELETSFSFIVTSDTHICGKGMAESFARIEDILIGSDRFIVITGDVTNSGRREEFGFFLYEAGKIFAAKGIPVFPVIGNHDILTGRGRHWREFIGPTIYRIDSGTASLFILDNAQGIFGHQQHKWLEREMRTARKHTFVFAHQNFMQMSDVREVARILAMLENRAAAMFMGHVHSPSVREIGNVKFIIPGTAMGGNFFRVRVSDSGVTFEHGNFLQEQ